MSILIKKGITGFHSIREALPAMNDYKNFRNICYSMQNVLNRKIIDTDNPDYTNYFLTEFDNKLYFLLNKYYPIAGFTNEISTPDKIFIDAEFDFFTEYEIIPAVILNSGFKETENNLSQCELEQVKYYNPVSVGNIIFNEWD